MKKIISLLLLAGILLPQAAMADPMQSTNAFEIEVQDVPPGGSGGGGGGGGGLSSGAVTAIALGSVFGGLGVLGGVGYYFYKNNLSLKPGAVSGQTTPYCTVCINDDSLYQKLLQNPEANKNLLRGFECLKGADCASKRFLILPDSKIANKTFNTTFFDLPEFTGGGSVNVKITQLSMPYTLNGKMPTLDTKILLNPKGTFAKEVPTVVTKNDPANGIFEKKGQITDFKNKTASLSTYFNSNVKNASPQVYAVIVEFSK